MSQKSHFTTKAPKDAQKTQIYIDDCEIFVIFVYFLSVLGGEIFSLFRPLFYLILKHVKN